MFREIAMLIGLFIFINIILISKSHAVDVKTYIPVQAPVVMKVVRSEQVKLFPDLPKPWYLGGLIEQESCISLTHSKCFNAKSRLKSAREEGAGLGQTTRAFNPDGSIRFDSLSDMVKRHNAELKELSWSNIYTRPDLQARSLILMTQDNYKQLYVISDLDERVNMADAAYNGGLGGVRKQRTICGLKANCNPQVWFNNVEKICVKSLKPLYGGKNACMINTEHVFNIRYLRMDKYKPFFE